MDKDIQDFKDRNDEAIRKIDESIISEYDLWEHYRPMFHNKEIQNSDGEAIGHSYVEKKPNNELRITCLFGSRKYPFSPTIFKQWIAEEEFRIFESQTS